MGWTPLLPKQEPLCLAQHRSLSLHHLPVTVIAHLGILAKEGSGSALRLINDS